MQRVDHAIARRRTARALQTAALSVLLCLGLCLATAPLPARAETTSNPTATGSVSTTTAGSTGSTSTSGTSSSNRQTGTAVCVIARVTAQVVTGTEPVSWQLDQTASDTARGNVTTLCDAVTKDDRLSVTLAISPLLVERWTSQAAQGDQASAACGNALAQAITTGRLELVSLGYADPDLSRLDAAGYDEDIDRQYQKAAAVLPAGRSTGTVPYGLSFPEDAAAQLVDSGITWAAVDSTLLRGGTTQPRSGLFTCLSDRNLALLAIDVDGSSSF